MRFHQNVCLNLCSPWSNFLLLPVCTYIKSFALTRVRLHQNVCFLFMHFSFYSSAPTSSLLFLRAFVKKFPFTRVRLQYIKTFPLTRVHLHQNVCLSPCAPTLKVCFFCVHLNQNVCSYLCTPISKRFLYSFAPTSNVRFFCVRFHKNVSFDLPVPTSKVPFLCALSSKRFLWLVCTYTKTFALTHVRLDQTFCFYLCARTSKVFCVCVGFHQKFCFDSCAPASKCLLSLYALSWKLFVLLVYTYIKFAFFCAPIFDVAFTYVRLYQKFAFFACIRQKVSFYSCAPTVHQNFAFLCALSSKCLLVPVCAYIKSFFFVCALKSKRLLILVCAYFKTFSLLVCAYIKRVLFLCALS